VLLSMELKLKLPAGSSVSIVNDTVFVDGKPYDGDGKATGVVQVEIIGDPLNIHTERASVTVRGNVQG